LMILMWGKLVCAWTASARFMSDASICQLTTV
jgi:hypothetical protein